MSGKIKLPLALLLCGLLFSSITGFNFNLADGFHFHNFWIKGPLPIFDLAMKSSGELFLNSQLIGYLFYIIFGMISFGKINWSDIRSNISFIAFVAFVAMVIIGDFYCFYLDITHQFTGQHFRVGLLVFLLGLTVLYRNQLADKLNLNKHSIN